MTALSSEWGCFSRNAEADGPIAADGGSGDGGGTTPADDRDHDGLSNDDEESLYGTDPDQRDTDGIYSEVDSSMGATGRRDLTAPIMRGDVTFVLDTSLCVGQTETWTATTGSMTEPDRDGLHIEPAVVKWTTPDADARAEAQVAPLLGSVSIERCNTRGVQQERRRRVAGAGLPEPRRQPDRPGWRQSPGPGRSTARSSATPSASWSTSAPMGGP